jgi:hypothetical protein
VAVEADLGLVADLRDEGGDARSLPRAAPDRRLVKL